MKKRLFISVALALVLTVLGSAPVLAAKPGDFGATGTISSITPWGVFPAGASGRYVVVERQITGTLAGNIGGDFFMTYKANVELATQAGNLHGTLEVGGYILQVSGKIEPLEIVEGLPKLTISGRWTFIEGARGQGTFDAWLTFESDEYGHVVEVIDSSFTLTGKWNSD